MSAMTRRWLGFLPRDTVMVRDGRSFDAGPADGSGNDAAAVGPWPSTVAGAVTTAFGEAEPDEVRGPVLAQRHSSGSWSSYFPVPADVVTVERDARRNGNRIPALRLRPAQLGAASAGAVPAWDVATDLDDGPNLFMMPPAGRDAVEPVEGLLPGDAMGAYLADAMAEGADLRRAGLWTKPPLVPERRVGLAREARTAMEGYLYSVTHLRPADDGWGFLVECVDGDHTTGVAPLGAVPLGGKARMADVEVLGGCCWPAAPGTFPGGRVLLYVATPAVWPGGWRPPLPADAQLVGACVPAPLPVATASARRARQPRLGGGTRPQGFLATARLRWAVPAGAVYLVQFRSTTAGMGAADRAAAWAAEVHGRALGPSADRDPGTGADRTRTAGFGVVLTGRWSRHGATGGDPTGGDTTARDTTASALATRQTGKDHMK
ncbi:MAG: hypothetical protein JXA67_15445 [Micromonosporaceae bacterium]|nr:hypothetical protein [Micromonosporaceae bacterium]